MLGFKRALAVMALSSVSALMWIGAGACRWRPAPATGAISWHRGPVCGPALGAVVVRAVSDKTHVVSFRQQSGTIRARPPGPPPISVRFWA